MHTKQRVVVTGLGVCAPLGITLEDFWANAINGKACVGPITNFKIEQNGFTRVAAMANDFEPSTIFKVSSQAPAEDRTYAMAKYCIEKALQDAELNQAELLSSCGLFISSAISQMGSMESYFISEPGQRSGLLEKFSFGSLVGRLALSSGLGGGHMLLPTGCVGGCDAVSYGADMIRSGRCERAVVGAAEAPITPLVVAAFGRIRANSVRTCDPREASCPFDKRRDGFVLAEGAAMLLLESEAAARERGATIYAEILGSGSVNNCYHMTDIHPDGEAIAESCRRALRNAQLDASAIEFINAHGSSTPQNDVAESAAFLKIFGRKLDEIPVTSLKSQCGHALSAANAIEMISTIQSIRGSRIPPTINLENQDPACPLNVVAGRSESHRIRHALKVSSGFSGIHTALILSAYQG